MIICPGGHPNSFILWKNKILINILQKHKQEGRWYHSICVAPYDVLHINGLPDGEIATEYPD